MTDIGIEIKFEDLYEKFYKLVHFVCRKYADGNEELSDLIQDTFIRIYEKIGDLHHSRALSSWVYKVAYHTCLDHLIRKKSHNNKLDRFWESLQTDMLIEYPSEHKIYIEEMLADLDEEQRELITLAYLEGLKQEDISELTGYDRSYISKKLKAIRKVLVKRMKGRLSQLLFYLINVTFFNSNQSFKGRDKSQGNKL